MKKHIFLWMFLFCIVGCQNLQEWSYRSLFFGFAIAGFPITPQVIELQEETKITPEMISFFLQWKDSANQPPSIISSLDNIWNLGAVPCITWEPMIILNEKEKAISFEEILAGNYDGYLLSMANELKLWDKPVIIRFAHEMNLSRYHWGTDKEKFGPTSPEIYIKMFRYVVNQFNKQNVNNVFWAFCPNVDSIPNEPWNAAKKYYPGDEYVDILGMDGYDWGIPLNPQDPTTKTWRTFEQIFQPLFQELKSTNPYKPIIVFETATTNRVGQPKKNVWIQEAIKVSREWGIIGIVWFQVKKEEDWRIHQDDDYSYIPFIKPTHPSFQTWLLNYLHQRRSIPASS